MQCCREEHLPNRWNTDDVDFTGEHEPHLDEVAAIHPLYCEPARSHPGTHGSLASMSCKPGLDQATERWGCCRNADSDSAQNSSNSMLPLESLSYMPVRFDAGSTIDVERSDARYSKIVVHSTRARTQKRSKAWEDWLRAANAGRSITLLSGIAGVSDDKAPNLQKIQAMYYLDRALTKLSILPSNGIKIPQITIVVDNIQVICPATDFMLLLDHVDTKLDELEKNRAVLLQYVTEDTERKRICFLEESEAGKDRFVQALTALWLEKRNDHSMWF